ncbi:MAG: hypothetical protein JJ848_008970 [Prochlorococcus marinus CUG1439]|uniref:hypothetical protein n=1 Tax=Prochlorococcus sp. MIT 1314 TaxID=3096220 RepID=UPI001B0F0CC2|nr:hypothetical protein [Prochlorococcus sp. MIT 1314]MCR8540470.1 hypothetical protein [Prochlorococcus marinus CUG1439]
MIEKFKTLFVVKSSLISLYLALTIPIPYISSDKLKVVSIVFFFFGLYFINSLTSDCVETNDSKIYYKTSFLSNLFGKKNWEIFWKDIKLIKSLPTSQGSKVYYFTLNNEENYLVPQRIENLEKLLSLISKNTNLDIDVNQITYISPLWTYKLLTVLSVLMIIGEIILFLV